MPISLLPALILQVIVVGYSPGPANIYALTMAIKHGKFKALKAWIGMACGFLFGACTLAILVSILGTMLGKYIVWIKYLGAAYLLWLAWKILRSGLDSDENGKSCNFISGFIVQATNAKMLLYDISVFSTFVLPYSSDIKSMLAVIPIIFIGGPISNLLWLMAGNWLRGTFIKYEKQIDIISAIALAACAIYVVIC